MSHFRQLFTNFITRIENSPAPFAYFIWTFIFATTLRNFFEGMLNSEGFFFDMALDFLHYYVSYICLALALILLYYFLSRENIIKIAKIILPAFLILSLVPFIDYFTSSKQGHFIGYMVPGQADHIFMRYLTFFGPYQEIGVTLGMRIEIALVMIVTFFYVYIKRNSVLWGVLSSFLVYTLIFAYCALPYGCELFLRAFGVVPEFAPLLFIHFYLLLIFILGVWVFYLYRKDYFWAILKDIRILRLLNLELLFIFGMVLSLRLMTEVQITQEGAFRLIFIMIAIMFAWLYSLMMNNLADREIDQISNAQRPTITQSIPVDIYRKLAWGFFALALVYAFAEGF